MSLKEIVMQNYDDIQDLKQIVHELLGELRWIKWIVAGALGIEVVKLFTG